MKLLCALLLVAGCYLPVSGQQLPDSLKAVIASDAPTTERLWAYQDLAKYYTPIDSVLAARYINEGTAIAQEAEDDKALLIFGYHTGELLRNRRHYDEAKAVYEEVLQRSEAQNYPGIAGSCLSAIAEIHRWRREFELSISLLKKSTKLHQKSGHQPSLAFSLLVLARNYSDLQVYDTAIQYYQQSALACQRSDAQKLHAYCMQHMGETYQRQFKYEAAMQAYKKSLRISEQIQERRIQADILLAMGAVYIYKGDFSNARSHCEKSLELYIEQKIPSGIGACLSSLAGIHFNQGDYEAALNRLEESILLAEETHDPKGQAYLLNNMAMVLEKVGRYEEAIDSQKKSAAIKEKMGDYQHRVMSLGQIGRLYMLMQVEDSAFYYYQQAISLAHERNFPALERYFLDDAGTLLKERGRISKALEFYYQALEVAEVSQDTLGIGIIYSSLADIYTSQQNLDKAMSYHQEAMAHYQLSNSVGEAAAAQNAMATLLIKQDNSEEGFQYASQALRQFTELQDSCSFSQCLLNLGMSSRRQEQLDSALHYFAATEKQARRCNNFSVLAESYVEKGRTYEAQSKEQLALKAYQQALEHAQSSGNIEMMQLAAGYLYPVYQQRGQLDKAFATLQLYQASSDSLFNVANTRNLIEQEMAYDYEKKEQARAFARQQADLRQQQMFVRQRWIILSAIMALIALAVIMMAFYRNYRDKQRANALLLAQKAEIEAKNVKLEALDDTKSRFFANISHELRTPLTLISSPLQHLAATRQKEWEPEVMHTLDIMQNNADKLRNMVDNILDLSKLEAHSLRLQSAPVLISDLLLRISAGFDALAQYLNINYTVDIDELLSDLVIMTDESKLEKILNNLLSNAFKHTPSGGDVLLRAVKGEASLALQVSDNGRGISQEDLPHIFDRYYQSEQPDERMQGGTGLGLALVKELTQLMGGTVSVNSELGRGATFTITLNCVETITETNTEMPKEVMEHVTLEYLEPYPSESMKQDYHILVVEDHPEMQRFIESLLQPRYHVLLAANGLEAMSLLASGKAVDLIISDVMMPQMDGYTLLQQLKTNDAYSHLPVVMLTALNEEAHKLEALTIGVDDYLTKPFSPEELLARVHNLLLRHVVREQEKSQEPELLEDYNSPVGELMMAGSEVAKKEAEWIREVAAVILEELENTEFQLSDLAEHFHLGDRQFLRKVKKITGLSVKKYQQEIALNQARKYLEQRTFDNVSAVAYTVGIRNTTRFNQLYVARFGKKPVEYFS